MQSFIGQITGFGFNFAAKNWAFCAGQQMSIGTNQALFSILGTTYGGNGVQTFALPDLRGRVAVGAGQGLGLPNIALGEISGTQTVTVLANQLPLHVHSMNASNAASVAGVAPNGNTLAMGPMVNGKNLDFYSSSAGSVMAANAVSNNGGNQPISILQPYNVINYSVCLFGIYPSRN